MHYIIILVVVAIIIARQVHYYRSTCSKINELKGIFEQGEVQDLVVVNGIGDANVIAKRSITDIKVMDIKALEGLIAQSEDTIDCLMNNRDETSVLLVESETSKLEVYRRDLEELKSKIGKDPTFGEDTILGKILTSINNYLVKNNNAVCDFQLVKDIVDRNCEMEDEEIQTQIPIPLYLGLMGTMIGILVGVGYLTFSGDLTALLSTNANASGAKGVEVLLGGVALAMTCSICGIFCTTKGSNLHKTAKSEMEHGKHTFLSWMQAELLPKLSTDMSASLEKMTRNLNQFNLSFEQNTVKLGTALKTVGKTSDSQAKIIESIEQLNLKKIATANITVYEKLKDCSDEIGSLGKYLSTVNTYLSTVKELVDKLNDMDERTRLIEEMASYFKEERSNVDAVKNMILKSISVSDKKYAELLDEFRTNTKKEFEETLKHLIKQRESLSNAIGEQDELLKKKVGETSKLVEEVKNLQDVKTSLKNLEQSTKEQTRQISALSACIREVLKMKVPGSEVAIDKPSKGEKMQKLFTNIAIGSIGVSCLFFVILKVLEMF